MNKAISLKSSLYETFYRSVDASSLAVVRMLFGLITMYEAFRYANLGRLISKYTQADFHFKYRFFEWVEPLSTTGMQWVHIIYGIAGLCIFLGVFYHAAVFVSFLAISYLFLVESTNYLNHIYLVIIFTGMMLFIPAHRGWSIYALLRKGKVQGTVPGWTIWLLRFQIGLVYSYAALAKMNVDWINGMPLYDWIGGRAEESGIASLFGIPAVIYFFTYGGMLYDLLVVPLLVNKRTRLFGYGISLFFHLMNYYLFNIGIFPWFMIAVTTIFFEPDWPRKALNFLFRRHFLPLEPIRYVQAPLKTLQKVGLVAIAIHISFQALFPLRHFLYPGYVGWTEEGHNFAWHMKLRGKHGTVTYTVRDPDSGKSQVIDSSLYLTKRQITKMASRPDMILQFAHYLRDLYTLPGEKTAEVYAETKIRLNGRKAQRLVDPEVNLSQIEPTILSQNWLMPLRQPVWNAEKKHNRLGPAFKKDEAAMRAIHKYDEERNKLVDQYKSSSDT